MIATSPVFCHGAEADFNGDCRQDLRDAAAFQTYFGSGGLPSPDCPAGDVEQDGDVDLHDWELFAEGMFGPEVEISGCEQGPDEPGYEPGSLETPPASPCREYRSCGALPDAGVTDGGYLFSGEFYHSAVDLRIKGRGLDFVWARKYRSKNGPSTAMGNGWDYSHNLFIEAAGADRIVHDGNTRADLYTLQPNGKWARDEFFRELQQNPDSTYTLVFADTGEWNFRSLTNPVAPGSISSIVDRNGNTLSFSYDAQGRLTTITDSLNRNITVAYNADGFISTVTDFTGRQVVYSYYQDVDAGGSFGDLRSVRSPVVVGTPNGNDYPGGKTTIFTYSKGSAEERLNHNLLTITDPKGQTYVQNTYASVLDPAELDFDRLVRQIWGDPTDIIDIFYAAQFPCSANNFAAIRAILNDRVGNVKEFFYDAANRLVMAREFTGRAVANLPTTESDNRPTGKLRPGDPDLFETSWTYNDDALPTEIAYPKLNAEVNLYELDLDPNAPRRMRGNLRQVTRNPGPLGGDQASITESYTYETGFGGCGCGTNFVKTHTDARANTTTHTYDGAGNRIHTDHRPGGGAEDWTYNAFGQVTSHLLPANGGAHRRLTTYSYYAAGPQTGYLQSEVIDSGGFNLTTQYEYDARGNTVRKIHPSAADTLYTYNQLDQVVRMRSREPLPGVRYETLTWYDANDNVVRTDVENRDENGVLRPNTHFSTIYEYEILNHVTRTCQEKNTANLTSAQLTCAAFPAGTAVTTEYQYDANRNRTLTRYGEAVNGTDPSNTLTTLYDERDLAFRSIRAAGSDDQSTDQTDYDGNGNVESRSQGLESAPRIMLNTYDGYDRRTLMTDPMSNVTTYHYDANGNTTSQRVDGELTDVAGSAGNVRLSEMIYHYDATDRRTRTGVAFFDTQTQAPIGDGLATTITAYANDSQVTNVTDDNGHETAYTYDTANRLLTTTDAKGNTVTNEYDADSNISGTLEVDKSDLALGDETFSTGYAYDAVDRLIAVTDNIANTAFYAYDSRNNRVQVTDPRNNRTRYAYDGLNRLVTSSRDMNGNGIFTDSVDVITTQAWDDSSRLTSQTDDHGNTTMYQYDSLNRPIGADYADLTTDSASYDVHDNATQTIDPNDSIVTDSYDLLDRVTSKSVARGPGVLGTTFETYQYDGLSRVVLAQDDDSLVTRRYNSLSAVVIETQRIGGSTWTVTADYDGVGNQTRLVYPGGRVVVRTYDLLDRPSLVRDDPPTTIATYSYIGPSRVERRDYGNSTRFTPSYDGIRRMSGTLHTRIADGSVIDQRTSTWDAASNKTSAQNNLLTPTQVRSHTYDRLNRLTNTNGGRYWPNTGYTLDGVGNRTNITGGPDPGNYTLNSATPEPADLQMNQYTTTPFDGRQFDRNGNLIQTSGESAGTTRSLSYDYLNQLVQFIDGGPIATYAYDCFGRRIRRIAPQQPLIDGALDVSFYTSGPTIQNTQTGFGDSNLGQVDYANGSELDGAYARISGGVLYLMLTGNLESNFNKLEIFIDSTFEGQNRLRGDNPDVDFDGLNRMGDDGSGNGLTFEAGFTANHWIGLTGGGEPYQLYANYAQLLTNGGGQGYFLGQTDAVSNGVLSGGNNPFGIRCAINNTNTGGVTAGTGTGSGAGVITGIELAIPLAAIPSPFTVAICAFINGVSHDFVSNQVLGGIGGGGNLGEPRSVNFGSIAGSQYFGLNVPVQLFTNYYIYDGSELIEERSDEFASALVTRVYSKGTNSLLQMSIAGQGHYFHEDDLHSIVKVTNASGAIVQNTEYADYGKPFAPGGPHAGNLVTIYDSDLNPNPSGNPEEEVDDFWFAAPTQITAVTWHGGYDYTTQVPSSDNFVIRIYNSDPLTGLPSTLFYEQFLSPSQVTRTATGGTICCAAIVQVQEYQYQHTLSSPISVLGNTRYWLSLVNNTSGATSTWGWETSSDGNSKHAFRTSQSNPWSSSSVADLTFQFTTNAATVTNPFLYRSERFDVESGFYGLGPRYLDPRAGRFIARDPAGLWADDGALGNPFTFRQDNPVNMAVVVEHSGLIGVVPLQHGQQDPKEPHGGAVIVVEAAAVAGAGPAGTLLEGSAVMAEALIEIPKAVELRGLHKSGKRCMCVFLCMNNKLGGANFELSAPAACCDITDGDSCPEKCTKEAVNRSIPAAGITCAMQASRSTCESDPTCPSLDR